MSDQRPPLPPQPQPFRFWLPYRSNVGMGSWRQQPRPPPSQPMPSSPQPHPTTPPPPTPAGPTPTRRPSPHAVTEDITVRSESSDESDTIPVENSYSSQLRGGRPSMANLELTLSGEPPPTTGQEQSSGRVVDGNRGNDTTKIAISGFPRSRLFYGARAPYRREIEDGIKSLAAAARERETLPAPRTTESGQGYRVVTLAGHNVGASMVVGNGNAPPPETPGSTTARVATNVNSNVQSVNNSSMEGSTLSAGSPGVHVDIKSAREEEETEVVTPTPKEEDNKPKEPVRRPPLVVSRPARRRRCLRALMMENGSDTEAAARKPRPGACRFQCVADHAPPPAPATASNGGGAAGEGAAEDGTKSSAEEATR
ncbi:hypothetical protein HU200_029060 [Digitaria exilis]|uniref:Uncharacterized protein n=1 Tax=Digitaria exilis TaxID=1010633 RepID=A0A835BUX1_9POAL|nr:hypothetical protein HU200_029060 [Digitaria exilis]